jgi:hypothetical protein
VLNIFKLIFLSVREYIKWATLFKQRLNIFLIGCIFFTLIISSIYDKFMLQVPIEVPP